MDQRCVKCLRIKDFEDGLRSRVWDLIAKVREICREAREKNARTWEKFANFCRIPVIGSIFQFFNRTPDLVAERDYRKEVWFLRESEIIGKRAGILEGMKAADMEHWGGERVVPSPNVDPNNCYFPGPTTRFLCYRLNHIPRIPYIYDLSSAEGLSRLEEGAYVMCSVTRRLHPISECVAKRARSGKTTKVYVLKSLAKARA